MIGGSAGVGGVPGPWYLSVPKATKNTDAAKKFVKCAYRPQRPGHPVRASAWPPESRAFQKYQDKPGYESFKPLIETLNAPATATRPATAKWQQIVDTVLVPMLQKAAKPAATTQALLADAQEQDRGLLK